MSNLQKALLGLFLAVALFAAGRYSLPAKVITQTKTVTVEVEKKDKAVAVHTQTTETDNKDGSKTITTVTDTKSDTKTDLDIDQKSDTKTETTYAKDGVTLTALVGLDALHPANGYVFGGMLSKPILGPISMALEVQSNKTVSIGLGLKF